ncbi:unnamed protein product [Thelazia callipaeda]|uniref:ACB domain-containing protein n=1 Tax=Thelazia callipaeda TaxID=103827 RepID=A0A0N5D3I4_THECL|nr:unnamed protein product [Thelazia callipaeda]
MTFLLNKKKALETVEEHANAKNNEWWRMNEIFRRWKYGKDICAEGRSNSNSEEAYRGVLGWEQRDK